MEDLAFSGTQTRDGCAYAETERSILTVVMIDKVSICEYSRKACKKFDRKNFYIPTYDATERNTLSSKR